MFILSLKQEIQIREHHYFYLPKKETCVLQNNTVLFDNIKIN